MNVREVFEREINTNHVDRKLSFFISEFLKDDKVKNYLFIEFQQSQLIPSLTDYLDIHSKEYELDRLRKEHYSVGHLSSNITPFEDVVNKLRLEFQEQILNETLLESYKINDLHRTPLIQQLKKIEKLIDDFEEHIFSKLEDYVNQSKVFADSFFYLIDKIDNQYIKQRLANFILNHNENKSIFCKSISDTNYRMNEDETKWRALKRNFDVNFKKLIADFDSLDYVESQDLKFDNATSQHQRKRQFIEEVINDAGKLDRWNKFFSNKEDFDYVVNVLTNYLSTSIEPDIYKKVKLIRGTKSSLAPCFNEIYKRYAIKANLKTDKVYINIPIKLIEDFSNDNVESMYNKMTK